MNSSLLVAFSIVSLFSFTNSFAEPSLAINQNFEPTTRQESKPGSTLSVVTGNPDFTLKVNAFAQARYTFSDFSSGPVQQNFDLALARLAFSGTLFNSKAEYFFQFETSTFGNSNQVSLIDGWINYGFSSWLSLRAGRFLLPYSRQFYTHPGNLLFSDLSEADYAFDLPRAVGASISGAILPQLNYSIAATNSIRALDNSGQKNRSNAVASVARLEFDALDPYGYLESSPDAVEKTQLSFGIAGAINPVAENSAFQNVRAGETTKNLTADFGFRVNRFSAQAAYYDRSSSDPHHDYGFYGQAGYYIAPAQWEAVARYSWLKFGGDQGVGSAAENKVYDIGANYYIHGHHLKVQSDFAWIAQTAFSGDTSHEKRFRLQLQILF